MAVGFGAIAGTVLAGIGLGTQLLGASKAAQGQKQIAKASRQIASASQRNEQLRERQLNLESLRQRRQAVREAIIARSSALTNSVGQGAGIYNSGLAGGYGQIGGQLATNVRNITQAQQIGQGIFDNNAQIAQGEYKASQGQAQVAGGQAISNFGGQVINSLPIITRVGQQVFSRV